MLGNYADETTLLGTAGQIALGLTGLDVAADVRDMLYNITHWEWSREHILQTVLDGVGLIPVIGALKNIDEAADLLKHGDDIIDGIGDAVKRVGKTGKFIDNTTDTITKAERQVVDDLVGQGKTVERIPKDPKSINKSPDFKVNGVKTELKTLENANTNTGMKRIQKGFEQGAETVIIDARNSGLTKNQANEILARTKGKYQNRQLPGKVEIWINGEVITYP